MDGFQKNMFDKIQKKADVNPDDVFQVAESVKHADFSDEKTVRQLVKQLSKMANKPVSKKKEDKIVEAIVNQEMPLDMNSLNNIFK
ncbi:stage VI sporulation protein F [Thalassobacillus sp. CUG 92003]|uniref:stage VI sporulation protein F n=1 Tax=Thalassobacillus sp. CUG 92003 TaxID=2736641 RepID=UPI0015E6DEED|nr:stage VI sporulation protein F [Thalassobacillus sp. CUG 92003]